MDDQDDGLNQWQPLGEIGVEKDGKSGNRKDQKSPLVSFKDIVWVVEDK
jgi:hypothetical protein